MPNAQSWRDLLGKIVSDPKEKQRLIKELNVSAITLNRWVSGESDPRPQNLRQLISVIPQSQEEFLELLREERGISEVTNPGTNGAPKEIPSEFYRELFSARASMTENLRFWSMCRLILQQAIGQLDPEHHGIKIWVVRCMPPAGTFRKVRSLREVVGQGTPPWADDLEKNALFLGAESLAGSTVTSCKPLIMQNLDSESAYLPATRDTEEKSIAIHPILYAGRIAGVISVASAHYNHFNSQQRTTLIQQYADLLALAFAPEDFYAPQDIILGVMPPNDVQREHFVHYRKMFINHMGMIYNGQYATSVQADLLTWQDLENELLTLPPEILE
ncbi:MAG TPA: GAF domain-containing protein [Ktedonobacteraceae bacterium]|jgi:hypothetical protein|nr:GAF domain-containing protein [Ktedonobacteraceae bacterium]